MGRHTHTVPSRTPRPPGAERSQTGRGAEWSTAARADDRRRGARWCRRCCGRRSGPRCSARWPPPRWPRRPAPSQPLPDHGPRHRRPPGRRGAVCGCRAGPGLPGAGTPGAPARPRSATVAPPTARSPRRSTPARREVGQLGDELLKLSGSATEAQAAARHRRAQTLASWPATRCARAQESADAAAADAVKAAAALPPGEFGSDLHDLDALQRIIRGDGPRAAHHRRRPARSPGPAPPSRPPSRPYARRRGAGCRTARQQYAAARDAPAPPGSRAAQAAPRTTPRGSIEIETRAGGRRAAARRRLHQQRERQRAGRRPAGAGRRAVRAGPARRPVPVGGGGPGPVRLLRPDAAAYRTRRPATTPAPGLPRPVLRHPRPAPSIRTRCSPATCSSSPRAAAGQSIHHVGMYIGGGKMVQAPRTGDVVKISVVRWSRLYAATRVVGAVPRSRRPAAHRDDHPADARHDAEADADAEPDDHPEADPYGDADAHRPRPRSRPPPPARRPRRRPAPRRRRRRRRRPRPSDSPSSPTRHRAGLRRPAAPPRRTAPSEVSSSSSEHQRLTANRPLRLCCRAGMWHGEIQALPAPPTAVRVRAWARRASMDEHEVPAGTVHPGRARLPPTGRPIPHPTAPDRAGRRPRPRRAGLPRARARVSVAGAAARRRPANGPARRPPRPRTGRAARQRRSPPLDRRQPGASAPPPSTWSGSPPPSGPARPRSGRPAAAGRAPVGPGARRSGSAQAALQPSRRTAPGRRGRSVPGPRDPGRSGTRPGQRLRARAAPGLRRRGGRRRAPRSRRRPAARRSTGPGR